MTDKEKEKTSTADYLDLLAAMSGSADARESSKKGTHCSEEMKMREYLKWDILTNGWEASMHLRLFDTVNKIGGYAASLSFGGGSSSGSSAMSSLGALALMGGLG